MTNIYDKHAPPAPKGRLGGQRFFRVETRDFYYVLDEPRPGYSGSRAEAWQKALAYADEGGYAEVEERTNQRLNDYVGSGVFGLCILGGRITSDRLSGQWQVGESIVAATYEVA